MDSQQLRYSPPTPKRKDFRIGILGSGFIVNDCHLVSYRRWVEPRGDCLAEPRESGRGGGAALDSAGLRELPGDSRRSEHRGAGYRCAAHVSTGADSRGVRAGNGEGHSGAEAAGAELWRGRRGGALLRAGGHRAVSEPEHALRSFGVRGESLLGKDSSATPVFATIDMRAVLHWQPWQADMGSATLRIMSIHHLDCMRGWFGDPERVFTSTRPDPRTKFPHTDGICTTILEYANGLRCVMIDDPWTGPGEGRLPRRHWHSSGALRAWMAWRSGILAGARIPSRRLPRCAMRARATRSSSSSIRRSSWFPDAFGGTMSQLLIALETGQAPALTGRDNLKSIALVEAAALSAEEHRMVIPAEMITGIR